MGFYYSRFYNLPRGRPTVFFLAPMSVAAAPPFLLAVTSPACPLLEAGPEAHGEVSLRGLCLIRSGGDVILSVLLARRPKRGPQQCERRDFPLKPRGGGALPGHAAATLLSAEKGRWQILVPHQINVTIEAKRAGSPDAVAAFMTLFQGASAGVDDGKAFPSAAQADLAAKALVEAAAKRTSSYGRGGYQPTNTLNGSVGSSLQGRSPSAGLLPRFNASPDPPRRAQAIGAGSAPAASVIRGGHGSRMINAARGHAAAPPSSSGGLPDALVRGRAEDEHPRSARVGAGAPLVPAGRASRPEFSQGQAQPRHLTTSYVSSSSGGGGSSSGGGGGFSSLWPLASSSGVFRLAHRTPTWPNKIHSPNRPS